MMAAKFNIAGRFLIAASVLLTGTVTPGMSHAHGGGCRPHEHRDQQQSAHKHSHHGHSHASCQHPHAPSDPRTNSAGICTTCTRHVHISCFGWSLTLPGESGDGNSADQVSGSHGVIVVRPFDVNAAATSSEAAFGAASGMADAGEISCFSLPALDRPRFSSAPIAAGPLCDTARHERSGVQLS